MKEKGKWQTAAEAIMSDRKKANQVDKTISPFSPQFMTEMSSFLTNYTNIYDTRHYKNPQIGDIIEAVELANDPKESTAVTRALLEVFSSWCRFVTYYTQYELYGTPYMGH